MLFRSRLFQYHGHHFDASQVVRLPGSVVPSLIVLFAACTILWRRRDFRSSVVWVAAFGIASAVVLIGKETMTKPLLFRVERGQLERVDDFTSSFPSGHTSRIVLLAALFTYLWPRLRLLFVLWAVAAIVSLEIDRIHTPSDIAGGILLATAIILAIPLVRKAAPGVSDEAGR